MLYINVLMIINCVVLKDSTVLCFRRLFSGVYLGCWSTSWRVVLIASIGRLCICSISRMMVIRCGSHMREAYSTANLRRVEYIGSLFSRFLRFESIRWRTPFTASPYILSKNIGYPYKISTKKTCTAKTQTAKKQRF